MDAISRGAVYEVWSAPAEYTAQQTDTALKAAPGAGKCLFITDIVIICNGSVTVTLEDGSTAIFKHYADGQGSGVSANLKTPIKITENAALTVTTSGAVTVFVLACGYTGKAF